ncbi:hypothetical protein CRENBAI_006317 [Crenichthys baileyi]|uniref:Uncharacterized protein n=1 Tax=Crenichthys baileyi TaxID=28760 RepID=A0AAV9RA23_9TELE
MSSGAVPLGSTIYTRGCPSRNHTGLTRISKSQTLTGMYRPDSEGVIVVPEFGNPLTEEQHTELQLLLAQHLGQTDTKELYLLCREYVNAALSD